MKFIADFHIHSKFSRATAKNLDLEHLYIAAQIKGISVLGTGDFTHPAWWDEINTKLLPAEEGLFTLREDIARQCDARVPQRCRRPVRFLLVTEISNIYKKEGQTRKNHNLVFLPHVEAAERFNRRLAQIGNIVSDGRPILGLDARNLLEIVLENSPSGFLIPAHIWTPWFSLLGSKSGFDMVGDCFADLTSHVFALETGLSSDPSMNWRVSKLDRFTLISNSDAHSPAKVGREANIFNTELSYPAIRKALETADPNHFLGTMEFYPQEGKYHVDGHRKCNFRCHPQQSRELNGLCPICGKPLTLGVLYRVDALADREQGIQSPKARPYSNLIPLEDLLSEVLQTGTGSKKVSQAYEQLVARMGSEFDILQTQPLEELAQCGIPLLAEAIRRMRANDVCFEPGYDGEFGQVRLFNPEERQQLMGQRGLFAIPQERLLPETLPAQIQDPIPFANSTVIASNAAESLILNSEQQAAVDHGEAPLLIIAGPGTGKTRTITCRMASLIVAQSVNPDHILAVTFTQKAAQEMRGRLKAMLAQRFRLPLITTFHSLCWQLLKETFAQNQGGVVNEADRRILLDDAVSRTLSAGYPLTLSADALLDHIICAKQHLLGPADDLSGLMPETERLQVTQVYAAYQEILALQLLFDFEDLIFRVVRLLEQDTAWRQNLQRRFFHIFIDEFQDINYGQYRLIRALRHANANLCAIGDPDQAIYGFRGSDVRYFEQFCEDYDGARVIRLSRNYRSTETILNASFQVIQDHRDRRRIGTSIRTHSHINGYKTISIMETPSAQAEAVAIGKTIEQMVGGTGFHAIDFGKAGPSNTKDRSFSDFAVLFRTNAQGAVIADVLTQAGIPCQMPDSKALREHPSVAKLLSVLCVMTDRGGYADLNRLSDLTKPGVGRDTIQLFKAWAYTKHMPLSMGLATVIRIPIPGISIARQQRLVNLIRLLQRFNHDCKDLSVAETIVRILTQTTLAAGIEDELLSRLLDQASLFGNDLQAFLTSQALQHDTDLFQPQAEKVALLTMHAAKGLEFPIVFIAGCEDGLIPYRRSAAAETDVGEERRLFYVAMTRARDQLFLAWAHKRTLFGQTLAQNPSPFLDAIDDQLVEQKSLGPVKKVQQQLLLF